MSPNRIIQNYRIFNDSTMWWYRWWWLYSRKLCDLPLRCSSTLEYYARTILITRLTKRLNGCKSMQIALLTKNFVRISGAWGGFVVSVCLLLHHILAMMVLRGSNNGNNVLKDVSALGFGDLSKCDMALAGWIRAAILLEVYVSVTSWILVVTFNLSKSYIWLWWQMEIFSFITKDCSFTPEFICWFDFYIFHP